jgi:hypothetical protein
MADEPNATPSVQDVVSQYLDNVGGPPEGGIPAPPAEPDPVETQPEPAPVDPNAALDERVQQIRTELENQYSDTIAKQQSSIEKLSALVGGAYEKVHQPAAADPEVTEQDLVKDPIVPRKHWKSTTKV